jgi:hypothetical protein
MGVKICGHPGGRPTPLLPFHDHDLIDKFAGALVDVWQRLDLPFNQRAPAAE